MNDISAAPSGPQPNRKLGFSCLFLIEMWERFGFYGMQILIVMFLSEFMGLDDRVANLTWGAFAMMIYTTPIIGGWIGDKVLGTRRTTLLGAIVLAIGYLMLALPVAHWFIFFSFGVIAVGNGLFKANPNNLLSQLYEDDEGKLDSAFTIYYMAINLGALISQAITPIVRQHYGWHIAFGISAIGLAVGIVNYLVMQKHLAHVGSKPDFERLSIMRLLAVLIGSLLASVVIALIIYDVVVAKYLVFAAAALLIGVFIYLIGKSGPSERKGVIATFILTLQGLMFFVFYQQMSTSLTFFAKRNVDLNIFGYSIAPEQFQMLNPLWIFILSPILAVIYLKLSARDKDFNIATKFALGFVMLAVGFFIYGASGHTGSTALVSPWWMVSGYLFQSFGELLISGLGLAMVARFVAPRLRGFIMGGWLLTTGISQFFGSMVANVAQIPDKVGALVQRLPEAGQHLFAQLPQPLGDSISKLSLGAFRYWNSGASITAEGLKKAPKSIQSNFANLSDSANLPALSQLSDATRHNLMQVDQSFYHSTLVLYTNLFLVLGLFAVGAALLSFVLIPYLKRLGAAHVAASMEDAVLPEYEAGNMPPK